MWSDSEEPYVGKHYTFGRTLNSPQSVQRPHPPILIGGGGERKTLRMVAQYAQACNLFPGPELERKLDVLRGHCEQLGPQLRRHRQDRDDVHSIPVTRARTSMRSSPQLQASRRRSASRMLHTGMKDASSPADFEVFGDKIIPEAAKLLMPPSFQKLTQRGAGTT